MAANKEAYINKKFLHDRGEFNKEINISARSYLIANEIANGLSFRQIAAKFMNDWGVSYNYMRTAINEAIEMFSDETIYKNLKQINNERLGDIYKQARETGDLDVAIKAVNTINKLNGLYNDAPQTNIQVNAPQEKITVTFGGEDIVQEPMVVNAEIIDELLNENKPNE